MREIIENLKNLTHWKIALNDFQSYYNQQINDINPNVKEWPLMSSPLPTIYLSIAYLIIIKLLGILMRRVKELNIKYLIILYNFLSILLNIYISFKIVHIKHKASDFYFCTTIQSKNGEHSLEMNRVIWWFYVSKGIEFFDTIFFLLSKKFHKISFLHIYNHATMFLIWWFCTAYLANGTLAVAALMNSVLHILLYYYYIISDIGPKFQKYVWWKRYFVQLQMLQFSILIVGCSYLLYLGCDGIDGRLIWCVIYYSLSHIALIYDFYSTAYYKVMVKNLDKKMKSEESSSIHHEETNILTTNTPPPSLSSKNKNTFFSYFSPKSTNNLDASSSSSPNDFKIQATRRRPLH